MSHNLRQTFLGNFYDIDPLADGKVCHLHNYLNDLKIYGDLAVVNHHTIKLTVSETPSYTLTNLHKRIIQVEKL